MKFPRRRSLGVPAASGGMGRIGVPGGDVGRAIERTGLVVGQAVDALAAVEAQRIDREMAERVAQFEIGLGQIKLGHREVGDPDEYAALMVRDIRTLGDSLVQQAPNEVIRERLGQKIGLKIGEAETSVGFEVATRKTEQEVAKLSEMMETYARLVAEADTEVKQADLAMDFLDIVDAAEGRRVVDAKVAQTIRQGFKEAIAEVQAMKQIELDPAQAILDLKGGKYSEADPKRVRELIRSAEAEVAGRERERRRLEADARREENVRLHRKLRSTDDPLTMEEVNAAQFLTREDREFFWNALRTVDDPRTDPGTFVAITDLVDTTGKSRDQQIKDATKAKALAKQAYMTEDTLAKADASKFIEDANTIIAGEKPEQDSWFKLAEQMIRRRFGVLDPLERKLMALRRGLSDEEVGRELSEGETMYYGLITKLKEEMEQDTSFRGKKVWDRAMELTQPDAVNFWNKKASQPERPLTSQLPNPLDYPPDTIINVPSLGRTLTNGPDRKEWR
ncbi:hypothetical protein LCGC14_1495340 [marine sediment metagenome]|uniref:Uncharacterized protein n=1 Tax=marine sediment metagenome TaxID=412755 RepID=A0A0F9LL41_9ZZZZ